MVVLKQGMTVLRFGLGGTVCRDTTEVVRQALKQKETLWSGFCWHNDPTAVTMKRMLKQDMVLSQLDWTEENCYQNVAMLKQRMAML